MAIIPYEPKNVIPDASQLLSEISQYGMQSRAMLSALGDYWTAYYRDLIPLAQGMTGGVAAFSKEYTRLLDMVRASNILDVPITQTTQFELLTIDEFDFLPELDSPDVKTANITNYFVWHSKVVDTQYLTTSLFEAPVVLEKGKHFDVDPEKHEYRFYVDLFNDPNITNYAYEIGEVGERKILLWACDLALSSTVIYDRFGRFLYRKSEDGEQYKWFVTALMRFFVHAKSETRMTEVLNILYGVPYTRYPNETITDIYYTDVNLQKTTPDEAPYICIVTDKAQYYTYAFSKLTYKVGDTVPQFTLLSSFNEVQDYVTHPGWWEEGIFPKKIVEGSEMLTHDQKMELMDKVLKYNTVFVKLGVSFETYRTYLRQVNEFYKIIKSGFPVYLYPLVEPVFYASFFDTNPPADESLKMLLHMGITAAYDYGRTTHFDGTKHYYMEPDKRCCLDGEAKPLYFDGTIAYEYGPDDFNTATEKLSCDADFSGSTEYWTDWALSADASLMDEDKFNVTAEPIDSYPWETAPNLGKYAMLKYSAMGFADGAYKYGDNWIVMGNDIPKQTIAFKGYSDSVVFPSDDFAINVVHRPNP